MPSPWSLPPGLLELDASHNKFVGAVPTGLPSGLEKLYLSHNALTGPVPAQLPESLTELGLGFNELIGSIPTTWRLPARLQVRRPDDFCSAISTRCPSQVMTVCTLWVAGVDCMFVPCV